jgi:hypothetical protein
MRNGPIAVLLVVLIALGAGAGYLAGIGSQRTNAITTQSFTTILTTTQIGTVTQTTPVTTSITIVRTTNSSQPGLVRLNGLITSQVYKPVLVKFAQDECTNAAISPVCNPCLNNTGGPNCRQNVYSANITNVRQASLTFYGNFSIVVPNGFGYIVIPWLATSSNPNGVEGVEAGYFLVNTKLSSMFEPGIECFFPNSNYTFANDICKTVGTAYISGNFRH